MKGRTSAVSWRGLLPGGDRVRVLVRPTAINLLVNDEHPSYTFDSLGRLHGAFVGRRNFRRSLDNRVLSKWSEVDDGRRQRRRRWLSPPEARVLVERVYALARAATGGAGQAPEPVRRSLARVVSWNWDRLEDDRRRFEQIYTPIGILPPDQYLALVLQATHGCSHNACTFCTFYRDSAFRIKTQEEFRAHVAAVLDFFGAAVAMRRSIFLADANALVVPMPRLLALLDALAGFEEIRGSGLQHFRTATTSDSLPSVPPTSDSPTPVPLLSSLPIFAFIDAFHVHRKSLADWQDLRARGLRRIYIGMESGHDPLLHWLNKPGEAADVLHAVSTLKAAGLSASVVIMLGVGGDRYAGDHVADTVRLLNAMPLGAGDIIYFSDFVIQDDAPYAGLAAPAGIGALDQAAMRAQEAAIRAGYRPLTMADGSPQFSRYDIEEFLY